MFTRREFLQQAALLAAIQKAFAIDPREGSTYLDAEHIVVLMQENRSFDHALGALRGVRGFNDPRAVTLPDNKSVFAQTNVKGETYTPFRLNIRDTSVTWLGSLPHSWRDQSDARNYGNHDKWLDAKPSGRKECAGMPFTLGYYNREDLPFYYALADAFTVCDQNFCSSLTGTTPNRLYLWSGTIQQANVRNSDVTYTSTANWTTFPERLEDAGISWRVYQNELSLPTGFNREEDNWLANFTDNPLEWFDQYNVGHHQPYQQELAKLASESTEGASPRRKAQLAHFARERKKWSAEAKAKLTPREQQLHAKAFTTNTGDPAYRQLTTLRYRDGDTERQMQAPKGDPLHQFRADVAAGKLPTVSWLVPSSNFSDHPGSPWYGAWFLAEAMNILTQNPEVWKKTIFVLTYDENDGYFDHVPPFVVPEPGAVEAGKVSPDIDTAPDYLKLETDLKRHPAREARGGPVGLGYRVPMIVASPWSRGGFVCSQVFDHTSVLQLMESVLAKRTNKPIRETNISTWRRAICGNMSSVFRPYKNGDNKPLSFPAKEEMLETIHKAQFKALPTGWKQGVNWQSPQEKGTRPAAALPYVLHVDAALNTNRTALTITIATGPESGAPFHAYTPGTFRNDPKRRTRAYALTAGGNLTDDWDLDGFAGNNYDVRVHGPNGFYREFSGTATDAEIAIQTRYKNGGIELVIQSAQPTELTIKDESYGTGSRRLKLAANKSKTHLIKLAKSANWYDFSIQAPNFRRRYAGHVETGRPSTSDPAMAG